jgi:putative DNA primase/helicase
MAVRIKIKLGNGSYTQRYHIESGWQAHKPDDFQSVPYVTTNLNPFDPELKDDQIFWPEGEKDVDTLNGINLPAFTFGGVGDGLPDDIDHYLVGWHLVIPADNDERGREHVTLPRIFIQRRLESGVRHYPLGR